MKPLVVVLVLGLLLAAGLVIWSFWSESIAPFPADVSRRPEPPAHGAPAGAAALSNAAPVRTAPAVPGREEGSREPLASECTLAIGDCYVIGEAGTRPRDQREAADLWCLDIRGGAALRCPGGAAPALAPMTGIGLPENVEDAAALLPDAPDVLDAAELWLAMRPTPERAGLGFVRSRSGATWKLWLAEVIDHADALERRVRIRFAAVPATASGGRLRLPQVIGSPSAEALAAIRSAIDIGERIPGQNFHSHLNGAFVAVEQPGAKTTLRGDANVVFERLTDQAIEGAENCAVFVGDRLGREASIVLHRGGAAGIGSHLEGVLRTEGYAFLFVGGDVTGTLDIRSYTTAVVLGDVRGTIRVRSYTDLYVRGRILGTLDLEGSGWCRFWFQSFLSRFDLEQLPGNHQVTVHVMNSDLAPGKHTGVGRWREVIVGDPAWRHLAR